MFCTAKLSTSRGFTKRVKVDVLCLNINDILEFNLPYMQSGSDNLYYLVPSLALQRHQYPLRGHIVA